jgi:hypothetical protein
VTRPTLLRVGLGVAVVAAVMFVLVSGTVAYKVGGQVLDNLRGHGAPAPVATADLRGSGPGSLVSATTMPNLTRSLGSTGVQSARVLYRSTSGDTGAPSIVSGTVFVPHGDAPAGGWPVVSFGHGTTGIQEPCAPSESDTLLGQAPLVAGFTKLGYAVAFADYQGLGAAGIHPYLDARTAGLNVIDAVRALRATFPNISTRWAAFGGSQGGGAVWAADEQAGTYAPEMQLVGAVALSPASDMTGLVAKAQQGSLTSDQGPLLQWVLASLGRLHPDLDLNDFRRGVAAQYWDALSACSGPLVHARSEVAKQLAPHDLSPSTPQAADRLRTLLQRWALPQRRLSAPLSIVYGADDTYIDPPWTTDAIRRSCALGGTLVWHLEEGKGHADIDGGEQLVWLADRFAGKEVTNGCR